MKTLLALFILLTSLTSQASGWMTLNIGPGTVFTGSENRHIAIIREQKSPYPSENYECTLTLTGDISKLVKPFEDGTPWKRQVLTKELHFTDSHNRHEVVLTADRSSECLQWGEEYEEEGMTKQDCLKHAKSFRTTKNILNMRPTNLHAKNLSLEISCEKWMSDRVFQTLDHFFHALYKSKGHFPAFLDLELD